jgi:acyl carrier protein
MHDKLQEVFRQVFSNPALVIADEMTAADVSGWDSLTHVRLVVAVEKAFQVRFKVSDLARLRCVGDLKALLAQHPASAASKAA